MTRRALKSPSVLSLLLCVAVCVLWVRSYRAVDGRSLSRYRSYGWMSGSGRVALWVSTPCDRKYTNLPFGRGSFTETFYPASRQWTGERRHAALVLALTLTFGRDSFAWARDEFVRSGGGTVYDAFGEKYSYVYLPHWCIAAVLALPPVAHMLLARRGRGRNAKLCRTCGYDLRATPDRCPECGTVTMRVGEA